MEQQEQLNSNCLMFHLSVNVITSAAGTSLYALRCATHLSFHQQGLHKQSKPYRRRCGSLLRLLETEYNGVQLGESFSFSDAKFGHDVWITRISELGTPRRLTSTVQPVNIVSHCQPLSLCAVQVNTVPYLTLSWLLL